MGEELRKVRARRLTDHVIVEIYEARGDRGTARGEDDLRDPDHYVQHRTLEGHNLIVPPEGGDLVDPATGIHYRLVDASMIP